MTLEDRRDEPAQLSRVPGLTRWRAPERVELSEDERRLTYKWLPVDDPEELGPESPPPRYVRPGPRMLNPFLGLADATPRRVAEYAQRWGCLGLDPDGMPGTQGRVESEAVADWQRWASEARAIMQLATSIRADEPPPRETVARLQWANPKLGWPLKAPGKTPPTRDQSARIAWAIRVGQGADTDEAERRRSAIRWIRAYKHDPEFAAHWVATQKGLNLLVDVPVPSWALERNLEAFVNRWLYHGHLALQLSWDIRAEEPAYQLVSPGLFGPLALAIAGAVAGGGKQAVCSNCLKIYERKEKLPKSGQNNFCPTCGKRASWKLAKRKERARKRSAGESATE
jgi:hypothetical protein